MILEKESGVLSPGGRCFMKNIPIAIPNYSIYCCMTHHLRAIATETIFLHPRFRGPGVWKGCSEICFLSLLRSVRGLRREDSNSGGDSAAKPELSKGVFTHTWGSRCCLSPGTPAGAVGQSTYIQPRYMVPMLLYGMETGF